MALLTVHDNIIKRRTRPPMAASQSSILPDPPSVEPSQTNLALPTICAGLGQ
jgi:hypothetical protein